MGDLVWQGVRVLSWRCRCSNLPKFFWQTSHGKRLDALRRLWALPAPATGSMGLFGSIGGYCLVHDARGCTQVAGGVVAKVDFAVAPEAARPGAFWGFWGTPHTLPRSATYVPKFGYYLGSRGQVLQVRAPPPHAWLVLV